MLRLPASHAFDIPVGLGKAVRHRRSENVGLPVKAVLHASPPSTAAASSPTTPQLTAGASPRPTLRPA